MIAWEKHLNPEQIEAVTAGDGPLLVLAAAGTGKTQTLVYRVACLVERGIPPDRLLLLTFTNRAAREMLERARGVAGDAVGQVWSGTFHHVCNRMLRRYAVRVGFRHDYPIVDRDDGRALIDECVKALGLARKEFPRREVLNGLFSQAANRDQPLEELLERRAADFEVDPEEILRVHKAYQARKRELGVMDFDDLLIQGLRLVEENADVRAMYAGQFRHILVDEYQDTNRLQARFVDLLAATHGNVMAVGDDFQCIYSWRGADFRNIMEFPRRYPAARTVKLERNYRSGPEILAVANACIAGNPEQFQKTLRAMRPSGRKPRVLFVRDGREQAEAVVNLIARQHGEGRRLRDFAVLYRAHFHSMELEFALKRGGLHYVITSGPGIFELAHVKDVLALLRVMESPFDRLAFERLLGLLYGVGPRTLARYWEQLGGHFDVRDRAQRAALSRMMKSSAAGEWARIDALFDGYLDGPAKGQGAKLVERFLETFYGDCMKRLYDDAADRADDVRELALEIGRRSDVATFLQEVALLTNVDHAYDKDPEGRADAVRLSTVHQAKGLEWPVVFVLWAVEGMFPSARSIGESEGDAEERRLFYVAVTRARDELHIGVPAWRQTRDGGAYTCEPSRFVRELPRGSVQSVYGPRT